MCVHTTESKSVWLTAHCTNSIKQFIYAEWYDKARKVLGIHELNRVMQIRQAVGQGESLAVLFRQRSDSENPNEAELLCLTSSGVLSLYLLEISTQDDPRNLKYELQGQWKITER